MSAPFTAEQEARIAQIVGKVLIEISLRRQHSDADDIDLAVEWVADRIVESGGNDA